MRVEFVIRATEGERYAPDAFDGNIGKRIPVTLGPLNASDGREGVFVGWCTLDSAEVSTDGIAVSLVLNMEDWTR